MKYLVLAACLIAVLGGVWWFLRDSPAGTNVVDPSSPTSGLQEGSETADMALVRANGKARQMVSEVAASTADSSPRAMTAPGREALVLVTAISRDTGEPLVGERLIATSVDERAVWETIDVEGPEARPGQSPKTNNLGKAAFVVPADQEFEVALKRGFWRSESATVPELKQGERFSATLAVPTEADIHLFARVVSEAHQTPVSGARVRIGPRPLSGSGEFLEVGDAQPSLVTDSGGLVEIWARSWEASIGEVRADGYGVRLFSLENGHETQDKAMSLALTEAASLYGSILGPSGTPEPGLTIELRAEAFHFRPPDAGELTLWSGPWRNDRYWAESTRDDGTFEFLGLAARVPFEIEIRRVSDTLRNAEPLVLEPGENREVIWRVGEGASLWGIVVDQDDEPINNQEMWLVAGGSPHYFEPYEQGIVARSKSNAEGRFSFDDVPPDEWLVGPAAIERAFPRRAPAPFPSAVTVLEGVFQQNVLVRVHRGLYVRGRVLGPDENPVSEIYVHGSSQHGSLYAKTGSKGKFAIGPLMPGPITLWVYVSSSGYAPPDPMEVEAGERSIVLRLRAGARLSGTVVERATGLVREAEVWATSREFDPLARQPGDGVGSFGNQGSFDFNGLAPGTYDLVARSESGQIGILRGITLSPGEHATDLEVMVEPGSRLRIRAKGRPGTFFYVFLGDTLVLAEPVPPGDIGSVKTVHPGTLVVRLVDHNTGEVAERTVVLERGEEGEVTFEGE